MQSTGEKLPVRCSLHGMMKYKVNRYPLSTDEYLTKDVWF